MNQEQITACTKVVTAPAPVLKPKMSRELLAEEKQKLVLEDQAHEELALLLRK